MTFYSYSIFDGHYNIIKNCVYKSEGISFINNYHAMEISQNKINPEMYKINYYSLVDSLGNVIYSV